ncbi:putative GNAT family N-acetyltransferase [Erwinia phage pEa_SNUABM_8]|nr:putative GNAT family N-acetyltransferase [Erwinia phage pEa_SNUABM_8]QVW54878.1 hypothetical protein pEaSNUABM4_00125 [Erwinia phage pEa_SNUABM_4]
MYTIARVFWGGPHARKLRELLQPGTDSAYRLDAFLKNPSICVYGLKMGDEWGGYFATSNVPGDETLACHHFTQLKAHAIRPSTIQLLLDHTGTSNLMILGETEKQISRLENLGFILIENNWSAQTKPYAELEVDKHAVDISLALADNELSDSELHELNVVLSCSIMQEGEYDPLERWILSSIRPDQVIERGRTGQYRTVVWREDGHILGIAQLEYTNWGGVSLTGMGVHPDHQKRRIGRNLVAAAMKLASQSHEEISATTFAGNLPAEHLLGTLLRYTKLPGSYGIGKTEDTVSWKRTKGFKKLADRELGPMLTE